VVEGRCSVCRAARDHVHHHGPTLTPQLLVAAALLLILGLLIATHVVA
jgi:preprotein translocase subunit Sec61beta